MPLLFFDPLFMALTLPTLALTLWAQWKVKSTFHRFDKIGVRSGMTGAQAAAAVMRAGDVSDIAIERHQGFLSDHFDPRARALRLSPAVHDGRSISAIAVAAHEAGHAIQDRVSYAPLVLRSKLVPMTNIGNRLWMLPFILGIFMASAGSAVGASMMWAGVALFAMVVVFQLVTLPTEFNASNRAKAVLAETGIVSTQEEAVGVSKVLNAAAMTYVAAAAASAMQLVFLVIRATQASRD